MSGLCGYPRTRGRNLPPHIAQALLDQGVIGDDDLGMFERHYLDRRVPEFLQATHADPERQPGAVDPDEIDAQVKPYFHREPRDEVLESIAPTPVDRGILNFMDAVEADLKSKNSEWREIWESFSGKIEVIRIKPGAILRRVVGVIIPSDTRKWSALSVFPEKIINDPRGSYWLTASQNFENEADWRAQFAVKTQWNGDHGYVEHVVEKSVFALYGRVAAQTSSNMSMAFPGGAHQVAVPFGTFDPTRGGTVPYSTMIKPMLWQERSS